MASYDPHASVHDLAQASLRHELRMLAARVDSMRARRVPAHIVDRIAASGRRAAIRRAARAAGRTWDSRHESRLDWRPGVGSGRAAHWHLGTYRRIAVAAEALHRAYPAWSSDLVRDVAHASVRDVPIAHIFDVIPAGATPAEGWAAVRDTVIRPAWAQAEAMEILAEDGPVSGYLVATILGVGDYSGCSGCEAYGWLRDRPEYHAQILARAPVGVATAEVEQTYPHEVDRMRSLADAGWRETLRLGDSLWHPPARRTAA